MKVELYEDAVLTCDIPNHHLKKGDIVKVVDQHVAPGGLKGFSIEVLNAIDETIAVTSVAESALEPLTQNEILCARRLAA